MLFFRHSTESIHIKYRAEARGLIVLTAGASQVSLSISAERQLTIVNSSDKKCQIVDIVVARSSIRLTESCVTPAEEIIPESRATEAPPMRKMKKNAEGDTFVDLFSPKRMSVVNSTQTIGANDGCNEVVKNEDNVRIADLSKSSRIESQSAIRDGPDRSRVNLEIDTGLRAHLGNENWTNRKFESPRTPSSGPLLFIRLIEKGGDKRAAHNTNMQPL